MKSRSYKGADKHAEGVIRRASDENRNLRDDEVLNCLRQLPFTENKLRRNVIPNGVPHVYSQCAGLTTLQRGQGSTVSRTARKCPNVVRVLTLFLRQAERRAEAEGMKDDSLEQLEYLHGRFPFTSITINYNYAAKPHRDSSHIDGRARIIALGEFTGGELIVEQGGAHPVRSSWVDFDGRLLHHVVSFC